MKHSVSDFSGLIPRLAAHKLDERHAQTARNCVFSRGTLQPLTDPANAATLPDAARISVYPYRSAWLSWITDVDVVKSPVTADAYQRIYYTGDGTPKVRGYDTAEHEYTLGIPAPTTAPSLSVTAKTATDWTRTWHYFYEEPDGTQKDVGDLTEGVGIAVTAPGVTYTLGTVPPRVTASASAKFVMWFQAYNAHSEYIGTLYPNTSSYYTNNDLYIAGAQVAGGLTVGATAVLTLTYDTSTASDFTAERAYVYTYVSGWGEEGPPSPVSRTVTVDPTKDVTVYGLPTAMPTGGTYNITTKRIYRTVTGDSGTEYQFIADVALATSVYTDAVEDADAGEVLETDDWVAPPTNLEGVVACAGGWLAGFVGNTLYFSEPFQPHAWPYSQPIGDTIVGLSVIGNALVVLTTSVPHLIVGSSPEALSDTKVALNQSCTSKRGICTHEGAVYYPSPDGLVQVTTAGAQIITTPLYRRSEWQALTPTAMLTAVHDNRIHIATGSTHLILEATPDDATLSDTDETVTAFYSDPDTDTLYIVQGAELNAWNGGITGKTLTWKGRKFILPRVLEWTCARVVAAAYPVTVHLYANGSMVLAATASNGTAFKLPRLRPETTWEFEVLSTAEVYEVTVADSMSEMVT